MNSLRIKCIKLTNFKSFGGLHIIDNLNAHLSIITGPNGSGKSNIIDALLFVLGFKAKKMRHNIQTELIYKDSKSRDFCSVEIIFTNRNDIIKVKRELFLNKKNKYYLNDKEVKINELSEFFTSEGVDLENNRFLILQGEIESISLMKPKGKDKVGMLEYLEEVIGTNVIGEEITKNSEEIELMKTENEKRTSSFKFYEKEMKYLEERKLKNDEEMKEYFISLQSQNKLENLNLERNKRIIKENTGKIEELESEKKILKEKIKELKKVLPDLEENERKNKVILKKSEEEFYRIKSTFKKLESEQTAFEIKKNKNERKIQSLKKEIDELRCKENLNKSEFDNYQSEIEKNEKEIKKIKKELQELNKNLENNKSANEKEIQGIEKEIGKIEKNILKLENEKNTALKKQEEIILEIKVNEGLKNKLEAENKRLKEDLIEISESKNEENLEEKLIKNENKIININNDIEVTWKELTKQRINLKEARNTESRNYVFQKVDEALKDIPGALGRLKDLGSIDEKYEAAVSAACKGALNFLVVLNSEVAEKCAERIRKLKCGKTTFIILDKIEDHPDLQNSDKMIYLINLVKTKEEYKKCFYFALKDTLVTETINEAKVLAFGKIRRRVVTLGGKLIEKSGLMCKSVFKKGSVFNKLKKYEKNVNELEGVLNQMRDNKNSLEERNKEIKNKIEFYRNKEKRIKENKEKIKFNENKLTQIKVPNEEKERITEEIEELQSKIIQLNKEISVRESNKLEILGLNYKRKVADKEIEELKLDNLERRNQELRIKKDTIIIEDYSPKLTELQLLEKELSKLKAPENYNKIKKEYENVENIYKESLEEYQSINDKLKELKNSFDKFYYSELEIKNKKDHLLSVINILENKNKRIKEETNVKSFKRIKEYLNLNTEEESFDKLTNEELEKLIKKETKIIRQTENKPIDLELIEEYSRKKEEFTKIKDEYFSYFNLLQKKTSELNLLLEKRHSLFMDALNQINAYLKEVYQTITFGGNAELELLDSFDPFSEGVILSVMPPKKVWRNIKNLSGGERTLASLSLVFALHMYKPSPFYVMDEIDAALDFKNVSIIANFLNEKTKNCQFLIISLRNDMFEIGSTFIGVYKTHNKSKVFLINE